METETLHYDIVIVGAGHGGAQTAISLRKLGYEGTIAIIGDEPYVPYERPPLSKEYFSGEKTFERLLIRPASFWEQKAVAMHLSERVISVFPEEHRVTTNLGNNFAYGTLVWAAGGRPRNLGLPGANLPGVQALRTRADADAMKARSEAAESIVVIGGGYIGLEAAAVLAKSGKKVTVLEGLNRVLSRVAGEELSRFFECEHRRNNVDLRLGVCVTAIEGIDRVTGVLLADSEAILADLVIVGIGIVPATEPLVEAGAESSNGILVDANCMTSLPDIYAIGDCAAHVNKYADGATIRLESVQNANDMAVTVATSVVGAPARYDSVPWFWSNQYDLRLQTVGLSAGYDAVVIRGDTSKRSFSCIYLKGGKVIALDCVNAVKDYVQGKNLVLAHAEIDPNLLADVSVPLKEMVQG